MSPPTLHTGYHRAQLRRPRPLSPLKAKQIVPFTLTLGDFPISRNTISQSGKATRYKQRPSTQATHSQCDPSNVHHRAGQQGAPVPDSAAFLAGGGEEESSAGCSARSSASLSKGCCCKAGGGGGTLSTGPHQSAHAMQPRGPQGRAEARSTLFGQTFTCTQLSPHCPRRDAALYARKLERTASGLCCIVSATTMFP